MSDKIINEIKNTLSKKVLAKIEKLKLDIDNPIKMNQELTLNDVTVFVGPNGSGKTFLMVCMYVAACIAKLIQMGFPKEGLIKEANTISEKCFDDLDSNGSITGIFNYGYFVSLKYEKGKIIDINHNIDEYVEDVVQVKFMSKNVRTFDAIKSYLTVRKLHNIKNNQDPSLLKMFDSYKMYDVMAVEMMISKMPMNVSKEMFKQLKRFEFKEEFTKIDVDLDKCDFYGVLGDGSKKYFTTYGAGHQSLMNIFLISLP